MKEIAIRRALNDETRKQGILISEEVYSLHITEKQEVVITDCSDYSVIYAVMSLDFSNTIGFT